MPKRTERLGKSCNPCTHSVSPCALFPVWWTLAVIKQLGGRDANRYANSHNATKSGRTSRLPQVVQPHDLRFNFDYNIFLKVFFLLRYETSFSFLHLSNWGELVNSTLSRDLDHPASLTLPKLVFKHRSSKAAAEMLKNVRLGFWWSLLSTLIAFYL